MRTAALILTALAVLAAPATAPGASITEANVKLLAAGDSVAVAKIPDGIYLRNVNDPDDIIWERLPEYRVEIAPAPAVHESVDLRVKEEEGTANLYLTLARTSDRFYVRMRWVDDTLDVKTASNRFRDGVAVQFSLGDDETSYIMGTGPEEPVNIWYWRSDNGTVQNLAAGGPGSTTMLGEQDVTGEGMYSNNSGDPNEWTVVMSRPLAGTGEHDVSFDRAQVPIAFAVWQGSTAQRDGLKSVSDGWILLDMGK